MAHRPSPLHAVLKGLIAALDLHGGLAAQRLLEAWPHAAGPEVADHAWADSIRGETLHVHTDSPVWAHQLQLLEPELLRRLAAVAAGECAVKRIRFRSATRPRVFPGKTPPETGASNAPLQHDRLQGRPTHRESPAAREAAAVIGDPELARALYRALAAQDQMGVRRPDGEPPKR